MFYLPAAKGLAACSEVTSINVFWGFLLRVWAAWLVVHAHSLWLPSTNTTTNATTNATQRMQSNERNKYSPAVSPLQTKCVRIRFSHLCLHSRSCSVTHGWVKHVLQWWCTHYVGTQRVGLVHVSGRSLNGTVLHSAMLRAQTYTSRLRVLIATRSSCESKLIRACVYWLLLWWFADVKCAGWAPSFDCWLDL